MHKWKRGEDPKLSHYFRAREFECHCGCVEQMIDEELVARLETLRLLLGAPIVVTSGYRCAVKQQQLRDQGHETAVGVSQHELGRAADISSYAMATLTAHAARVFKATGAAKTFVHCDLRDDKERRWSYK